LRKQPEDYTRIPDDRRLPAASISGTGTIGSRSRFQHDVEGRFSGAVRGMEGILDNEIGARQVNRTGWICQAQALFVIQGIVAVGGIEIDVTARNLVALPFAGIFSG